MNPEAAARRWAETLRTSWAAGDPEPFVALYADGAEFRAPFTPPESAVEHMRFSLTVGGGGKDVFVGEPLVVGDRAVVEWGATVDWDGAALAFAGAAWLRFDDAGLVVDEHDLWISREMGTLQS